MDPLLPQFMCSNLHPTMVTTYQPFFDLAVRLIAVLPAGAQRTATLNKLLEARDLSVITHNVRR